jgi:hypothetical protein
MNSLRNVRLWLVLGLAVAIAAGIGPMQALNLSLNDPAEYERLVSSAHIGIAGFGGAFLAMVGMKFLVVMIVMNNGFI